MVAYVAILTASALLAAVSAGFILASSPRQRATQLAAALVGGTAWWALCEAAWNAAPDPAHAQLWMRLSAPGWCFVGAFLPHLMARYLDLYPSPGSGRRQRLLLAFAAFGYAAGGLTVAAAWFPHAVHAELIRVPWGWTYEPGRFQLLFLGLSSPGVVYAGICMLLLMRSPLSVAPRAHRVSLRLGVLIPVFATPLTDIFLPAAGVAFPRLGSIGYALFGGVALVTGLRYGMTFFTPKDFSEEILETLPEGVAMVTPGGLVRRVNRGLARLVGCNPSALVGAPMAELIDWPLPSDSEVVEESSAHLRTGTGSWLPVSLSSVPLSDLGGNTMGRVVVLRDQRELEELRRRMMIQARLAAVGELVAGLAHEINNPLAYVRSNLAMLEGHAKLLAELDTVPAEERSGVADESRELIAESLIGVDRAVEIVRGVRRFTHAGTGVREAADTNELLEDCVAMLRPRIQGTDVKVELSTAPLPPLLCAPQELRQVFLNLLVNALDAVGSRGRVSAATTCDGDCIVVEIRDDGCGMEAETLDRIFDPFFTTKGVGEGTGLGLGIAWNIVQAQGGHIEVESARNEGTVFRVRLPHAPADAQGG